MAKVLPIGAVGIIGITVFALAYAAGDKTASGALFMIGYTGNLLTVKLAANAGVTLGWGSWFIAALMACLVSLLIVPLQVYRLTRPEIKHTPDAPEPA